MNSGKQILAFYIRGSVHLNSRLKKSNKMQLYADIYLLLNYSTCFGRPSRPSPGVHKIVFAASGTDHTIWGASFLESDQIRTGTETCTWECITFKTGIHTCPRRDSNPHSHQASGRRPTRSRGHRDWRLWFLIFVFAKLSVWVVFRLRTPLLLWFWCTERNDCYTEKDEIKS